MQFIVAGVNASRRFRPIFSRAVVARRAHAEQTQRETRREYEARRDRARLWRRTRDPTTSSTSARLTGRPKVRWTWASGCMADAAAPETAAGE
jgi:hypothetical protein